MKKWLSVVAVMLLCLALVIGIACGGEDEEEGVNKVKLGFGLPLSGVLGAAAGLPARHAMEMKEEKMGEFTVGGERYVWDFIFEDSQGSTPGGVASTNKFIHDHGVDFIEQSGADAGIAAAMITEELDPPMACFITGAGVFDFGPDWPHTFGVHGTWDLELLPLFDWLTKEHPEVKSVVVVGTDDRMGVAMIEAGRAACDYYGLEYHSDAVPLATTEYYPIATKVMSYEPDLVIHYGPQLFRVMWEMGYEGLCAVLWWTAGYWEYMDWDKAAGKLVIVALQTFAIEELSPEAALFCAEFEERYGVEAPTSGLLALVLPEVLTQAVIKAGTADREDVEVIVNVLETETFDTALGPMYFGCEKINGIGHILLYPVPLYVALGPGEVQVAKVYSPEEVEAVAEEIFLSR
jgi:ABC-type branched-subunit amino acid transport system substrate-binding protein